MTTVRRAAGLTGTALIGVAASRAGRKRRSRGVGRSQEIRSRLRGHIGGRGRSRKIGEGLPTTSVMTADGLV